MSEAAKLTRFEQVVLPHLDAAYNLARWLVRDEAGAEDVVQEACLRAFRFLDGQHGASPRAWFMTVVRNACWDWLKLRRAHLLDESFDERLHGAAGVDESTEALVARASEARWLRECVARLPDEYREVLVLREFEELSYREIGSIVGVPLGTVMSRLSRARDMLQARMLEADRRMKS